MDKVIDKIKKLLKHEQSARSIGSEAEANAFAEKIQELLIAHELEMSQIKIEDRDATDDVIDLEYFRFSAHEIPFKKAAKWQWDLAEAVCYAHFCKLLVIDGSVDVVFVGKSANRTVAVYMYEILLRTAANLAEIEYLRNWKIQLKEGDVTRLRGFKQAFYASFARTIFTRYHDIRRAAEQNASSTALVLRNSESELAKWMASQNLGTSRGRKDADFNPYGAQAGRDAAMNVNLNSKGVTGNGKPKGSLL